MIVQPRFPLLVAGLLAGVFLNPGGAAATEEKSPGRMEGARASGVWDAGVEQRRQQDLFTSLALDAGKLFREEMSIASLSTEELQRLADPTCQECAQRGGAKNLHRVGVNPHLGQDFRFEPASIDAIASFETRMAGGVARRLEDGTFVWTRGFACADGGGLRLHFTDFNLPLGVEIYLYTMNGEIAGPYTSNGVMSNSEFWSHTLFESEVYLELRASSRLNADQIAATRFNVADLAVINRGFAGEFTGRNRMQRGTQNAACVVDWACRTTSDWIDINDVTDATGFMVFQEGGDTFICSGGLIADVDKTSFKPYFLTANHCISTQNVASTLQTFFRYRSTTCNGAVNDYFTYPSTVGATLQATSANSDFCLLRLAQNAPSNSFFMGWWTSRIPAEGEAIYRLSHPLGFQQRYSRHSVNTPPALQRCSDVPASRFMYSQDQDGATEGGSSGSLVIDSTGAVAGQLFGCCGTTCDTNVCNTSNRTIDGLFAVSYPAFDQILADPSDYDGNLKVENHDRDLLVNHVVGFGTPLTQNPDGIHTDPDLNNDNVANVADVRLLVRHITGTQLP